MSTPRSSKPRAPGCGTFASQFTLGLPSSPTSSSSIPTSPSSSLHPTNTPTLFPTAQPHPTMDTLAAAALDRYSLAPQNSTPSPTPHTLASVGTLLGCSVSSALAAPLVSRAMADIVSAHGILSHPIRTHKYEKADARPPYAKRVYEYVAYGHQVEAMLVYAHSVVLGSRFQARPALTKLTETHMAERAYPAPQNEVFRRLALGHAMLPPPPLSQDVNGVLCRILPLALVYRHAPQSVVKDVVRGAVYPWHGTPELLDAGVLLFAFVKAAALCGGRPNPESLWGVLVEHAAPQNASVETLLMGLKGILAVPPNGPQEGWSMALEDACRSVGLDSGARSFVEDTALEAALLRKALGSLGVPQNSPLGVVAAVVVGVMRMWRQPLLAVVRSALMGGDGCDVTTSLVGGVLGALWGPEWLPREWVDKLENGNYGRDNMIVIAKRLAALDLTAYSPDW